MQNTAHGAVVCPYCGLGHNSVCPRVKAIEYAPNGTIKRVEFHEPQPLQAATLTYTLNQPVTITRLLDGQATMSGTGH